MCRSCALCAQDCDAVREVNGSHTISARWNVMSGPCGLDNGSTLLRDTEVHLPDLFHLLQKVQRLSIPSNKFSLNSIGGNARTENRLYRGGIIAF